MAVTLLFAAALASMGNPLLGTWVGVHGGDRLELAAAPTMTITDQAILFASGGRQVGVAPISSFARDDRSLAIRTRFGETYRFRFVAADQICRVPGVRLPERAAFSRPECFTRGRG